MNVLKVSAAVAVSLVLGTVHAGTVAAVVRDVRYSEEAGAFGVGDLYLPDGWKAEKPVVLTIHGGGWTGMDRQSFAGVAEFCARDLGYAAFNVDYRLASAKTPWPACGDDCVAAAKYLLSGTFAAKYGLRPKKVWVMGASAGGHLAIWTGLSLPTGQVAGVVSISGIADVAPDRTAHPDRYLFMCGEGRPELDPGVLVRPGGPKVLLTHARGDRVVPLASSRNFARNYRAAGNESTLVEYACDIEPNLEGHCIWRPNSSPRRLIEKLEREIAYFMLPPRVPTPQTVRSAVEITALYYPGTEHMPEWDMMAQTRPETKPLLGWYDEGYPEVVDWQVKWAVEHGITVFCVDWYWNRGKRRLGHWLDAFSRAHHRRFLKWYMMYANHNQPGAHSTEDQVAVTRFWIDNYFRTPEYQTVGGKPVVCYWNPSRLDEDFIAEATARGEHLEPAEGVRRAFAISERMVREAGFPGIHWQVVWRDVDYDETFARAALTEGFASAISYGIVSQARALAPRASAGVDGLTFDMTVEAMPKVWEARSVPRALPTPVALPTGWDARPRLFQCGRSDVIRGRTPEKFAALCRAARQFCDRHGVRRVVVHPVNEWQEGSYIEPNEEFGFAMYDAIRDAFCEKPQAGWPPNRVPSDFGLGPYDFPKMYRSPVQRWEFAESTEGWYRQPYGSAEVSSKDGCLVFVVTTTDNFNIRQRLVPFEAARYARFRVRMRVTPNSAAGLGDVAVPALRLKWGTAETPVIGPDIFVDPVRCVAGCPAPADGAWHEYALDLSSSPDWRGSVDELWFEASNVPHARVEIDWMRFESPTHDSVGLSSAGTGAFL